MNGLLPLSNMKFLLHANFVTFANVPYGGNISHCSATSEHWQSLAPSLQNFDLLQASFRSLFSLADKEVQDSYSVHNCPLKHLFPIQIF